MISVQFVDKMGDDKRVVDSARISFASKAGSELTEGDERLIAYLADHEHYTPFEHCSLSVIINCPIYISKQIMRHRSFSFNELSRRYTAKDLEIFMPQLLRGQSSNNKQGSEGPHPRSDHFKHRMAILHTDALALYDEMVKDGICKEQSRGILPQNTMTSFYMTSNIRNWAHFIRLRQDSHAQLEVQEVATLVSDYLFEYFPISMTHLLKD